MKVFALSDHHFGHQNIIKYCNRTLSLEQANKLGIDKEVDSANLTTAQDAKIMILEHNEVVKPEDLMIFGGDIQASTQGRKWVNLILPKLNGRKILIRGNHDHASTDEYLKMGFDQVADVLVIGNYCFCHYPDIPVVVDKCFKEKLVLCCGHTHKPFPNYRDGIERINLAVDVVGRKPIYLGDFDIPELN